MFTLFCRSSAAPAFTSSETTSVLSFLAATISGDSPHCVMRDMYSETLVTGREGSLHTRPSLHVWGREWYRQPSVSICKIYVKRADFSALVSQSDQHTQSTLSITEWWDQCHMFTTLFCRSSAAPAFTSSETTSVSPFLAASVSGESPLCVMTDMYSETLVTGREGSLHTRPSLHVWGREWYRQPSVSYVWVYNLSSGEDRTPYWTPHIILTQKLQTEWSVCYSKGTRDPPCPLV